MSDMKIYSVGLGLELDEKPKPRPKNMSALFHQLSKPNHFDVNFSYMHLEDKYVASNSSKNLNSTDFFNVVYNPFAGLNVDQKFNNYIFSFRQVFNW